MHAIIPHKSPGTANPRGLINAWLNSRRSEAKIMGNLKLLKPFGRISDAGIKIKLINLFNVDTGKGLIQKLIAGTHVDKHASWIGKVLDRLGLGHISLTTWPIIKSIVLLNLVALHQLVRERAVLEDSLKAHGLLEEAEILWAAESR